MGNMKLQLATLNLECEKWECIETNKARLILIPLNVKTITELMKQIYLSLLDTMLAVSMHFCMCIGIH